MSVKFEGQGQWVREVLKKFGDLHESQPKPFCDDPDWPDWVSNLALTFYSISHPGVKMKNLKKWKAKDLGRFLGREFAGEQLTRGEVPLIPEVIQELERGADGLEKWAKQRSPDVDLEEALKQYEEGQKIWRPIFKKFIQEVLSSACERPYAESSAFFEAFGKAIVIKPDELLTERTMGVGDKICWAMFHMWREIEQLQSVADLHRHLETALKPRGMIIKYKRIEKLCQRIKLKFKSPGRPPGNKIQTNSTLI
ncbi:MAG TPA: exodeoxyribonuclease VII small subunit [Candidatus Saccharimonadales bacterium]|nr:exodeoxyribonuclease VII small subunit [Candidatus Saccharimonadales bacterium]